MLGAQTAATALIGPVLPLLFSIRGVFQPVTGMLGGRVRGGEDAAECGPWEGIWGTPSPNGRGQLIRTPLHNSPSGLTRSHLKTTLSITKHYWLRSCACCPLGGPRQVRSGPEASAQLCCQSQPMVLRAASLFSGRGAIRKNRLNVTDSAPGGHRGLLRYLMREIFQPLIAKFAVRKNGC